jgi:hypothetical protein
MVKAKAARNDALIIFFMVDDPPESPPRYTESFAAKRMRPKEFRNQNR